MSQRKSIFEELNKLSPVKDTDLVIENRADHVIASAINLIEYIEKTYDSESSDHLFKRFLSSIKGKDPKRFFRALDKVKNKDSDEE